MKKFFVLINLFLVFLLVACGGANKVKLTKDEEEFVNLFTSKLRNFKDPMSVTVFEITGSYRSAKEDYDGRAIVFSIYGKNSYGATTTSEYILVLDRISGREMNSLFENGFYKGDMLLTSKIINATQYSNEWYLYDWVTSHKGYSYLEDINYNVKNINKAIENYKKDQGWV